MINRKSNWLSSRSGSLLAGLSLAVILSACEVEVDNTTPEIIPAGIYGGDITPDGATEVHRGLVLITSGDDVAVLDQKTREVLIGARVDNAVIGKLYASTTVDATAVMSRATTGAMAGTYSSSLGGGSFEKMVAFTSLYSRTGDLTKLEGVWEDPEDIEGVGVTTWDILSNGEFTVSGTEGCNGDGDFSLINVNKNEYQFSMDVTGCALAGSYTGFAVLSDSSDTSPNDTLVMVFSNGAIGGAFIPVKQ